MGQILSQLFIVLAIWSIFNDTAFKFFKIYLAIIGLIVALCLLAFMIQLIVYLCHVGYAVVTRTPIRTWNNYFPPVHPHHPPSYEIPGTGQTSDISNWESDGCNGADSQVGRV